MNCFAYKAVSRIRNGQLTASELCAMCVQQADRLKELNMYITCTTSDALKAAIDSDNRIKAG